METSVEACITEGEMLGPVYPTTMSLPKGVIRGCLRCDSCQKVLARWLPEGGHSPELDAAPIFTPDEEEFKDTLKYIASIRPIAEPYGICRIVPPPSWKPPCPLRDTGKWQSNKFRTRVQQIHKLQIRQPISSNNNNGRHKRRRISPMNKDFACEQFHVSDFAERLASDEDGKFGFDMGPEFTLETFQKYANDFKNQYFKVCEGELNSDCIVLGGLKERWAPSVDNIEGEYWRVVEKPTEQIEVLYGADLETGSFGSGFPKEQMGLPKQLGDPYVTSGWNLNNIARLPGSMLSSEEEDISGVVVPWLYIGMCFSSFCWHVEDHHFYSINYLHWGAPKVWYGVPGYAAMNFEHAMRKHLPHLFEEQPDLLQKLVTQLSPSILKSEGVPVYRCVQQTGEFILTFPRAYHAGFNCGFNCAEAVNVAPVDWLPHGQIATEVYQHVCRKTSVSHDKLLLGASREAVKILWEFSVLGKCTSASAGWHGFCGNNGLLTKALKARVERERARIAHLLNFVNAKKMDIYDAVKERECFACYYDLHLSAVGCDRHPEVFACFEHASQLCGCAPRNKFYLYRYDVTDLDILIDALQGKRSSINIWAEQDLGLSSTSRFNLVRTQDHLLQNDLPPSKSMSTPSPIYVRDLPQIFEAAKGQDRSNGKGVPRTQDAQAAAYVETIVLSDDEEDANKNVGENKEESMQKPVTVRDFCKVEHCDERTAVDIQSAEKHSLKQKEQLVITSLTDRDQFLNTQFMAPKELTTDEGLVKQHGPVQGTICSIVPKSNVNAHTNSLTMQTSTEASFHSKHSFDTNLSDRKSGSGRYTNHQNPQDTAGLDAIEAIEHGGEVHVDNEKEDSVYSKKLDLDNCNFNVLPAYTSYDVRLLDVGVIQPCKPWYNSQTIFPRGFKSCVIFCSVLDPTQMCTYISEVLDAGLQQPVFKVTVSGHPMEVFIHVSIHKCWELVHERINKEIIQCRSLGKENIPNLKPPGSLNGLEMFGFTSSPIVHAIETANNSQQCVEYWAARSNSSRVQCAGIGGIHVQCEKEMDLGIVRDSNLTPGKDLNCESNNRNESSDIKLMQGAPNLANQVSSENVYVVLENLFKKATPKELWTLHKVLSGESWSSNWKTAFKALLEELKKL